MLGFGFLLMVSLVIDAGLTAIGHYLEARFSGATIILRFLNSLVALAIAALLFAMIFKILPSVDITWNDVWMGALVTALLFTARQVRHRVLYRQERPRLGLRRCRVDRHDPALDLLRLANPALWRRVHEGLRRKPGSLGSGHTTGPQQETSQEIPARSPLNRS